MRSFQSALLPSGRDCYQGADNEDRLQRRRLWRTARRTAIRGCAPRLDLLRLHRESSLHEVLNGYPCGGAGEPCGPDNMPYFRPANNATRGQTSKIVSNTFFPACNSISEQTRG